MTTISTNFQHQTVFESVLISYSRINPELILSKLAFDFIREMVRLEGFQEREGEIVMKIPVRYYPNLCKRIIHILQNEYCLKSQSLIQLLCDSEIMRENDVTFVEHLIDEAHRWFMQNYKSVSVLDMQTVLNEACRAGNICVVTWLIKSTDKSLFDLNQAILAACLSKRNDLITLLVDSLDPLSFDMNILLRMCRKGHSGIVNQLLRIIRHFTLPEVIDCARKACEQEKLEIVQWLIKALNSNNYLKSNSLFDMKMALNIACQGEDEIHILEFLLHNVVHKQFDIKTGIETAIRENKIKSVQMLLESDAHLSIHINTALQDACRFNRIDIIKVLLQSLGSTPINIPTVTYVLNKGIEFNRPDIAKHVLDKYDHSLFDMKGIFTEACYNGKFEILGSLISLVDHKLLDMNKAIYAAFDKSPNISLQVIELLVTHIDHSSLDMATIREILHRACRNNEINKIKNLVAHFDNLTLDMKTAMNNAYRYFCSKKFVSL
ncbi:ANKRD17 [Mytilus edulis]|uniref:ANKRD17 n=1 Tax=Mytilus edulis TaxID=6550 RepID=A0A8S3RMN1_MYTED|nr:ANKRD17 [Mytilus edulis]